MFKILKFLMLLVFIYIISILNIENFIKNLQTSNIYYISIAFILNIPLLVIKSFRWKLILEKQNVSISLKESFSYYMASLYIGILTPGRIGEFSKVLYLKQISQKGYGWLSSSIILDRLFDLYFLVIFSVCGFYFIHSQNIEIVISIISFFIILPFILIQTSLYKKGLNFIVGRLFLKFKDNINKFSKNFMRATYCAISFRNILNFSLLTFLAYTIFFLQIYLLALSIGIKINFVILFFIVSITNLISLLPISISGLGTREMIFFYFFLPFGLSNELIVGYSMLIFLTFYIGGGLLGMYYFIKQPINVTLLK